MQQFTYWVSGTTCRSCELTIERCWRKLPDVGKVSVNASTGEATVWARQKPEVALLQQALTDEPYTVHEARVGGLRKRPLISELIALLLGAAAVLYILSRLGFLSPAATIGASIGFGAAVVMGLLAGASSCAAVVGGLMLSCAARLGEQNSAVRTRLLSTFLLGRAVGYALLGGLLGLVGSALAPSPLFTSIIMLLAALYMVGMGMSMLRIAPQFMARLRLPIVKQWQHRIMASSGASHWAAPFGLGAATFFLPCGFTQALQLYALTTHSFWASAAALGGFALGTAPALLVIGMAAGSATRRGSGFFFKFAGALVLVLGLWNIQNALAVSGHPLSWPRASAPAPSSNASGVREENGVQVVHMVVDATGYRPSHFTLKAGVPVRWEVDGTKAGGCGSVLVAPQLGVQKMLQSGINTIAFTPPRPGQIPFSCSMGMYRGYFTIE
jgi:sulfite exporter TauE/SafE/copper chaperone CopZ